MPIELAGTTQDILMKRGTHHNHEGVAIRCTKATIEIPLTQGQCALINTADLPLISRYRWTALRSRNTYYAKTHVGGKTVYIHRLIVFGPQGRPLGKRVDHVNGDGLDNRRSNLRAVTHSQNMMNSVGRPATRKSRYKGVSVRKHALKPYRACIENNGRQKHLGYFASDVEAARAYDEAAAVYFGCHARLNFPGPHASEMSQETRVAA